jgi:hypothetical protein
MLQKTTCVLVCVGLAACGGGELAPSRDLVGDPLLAALPTSTTLIAGLDAWSLRRAPAFAALAAAAGLNLPELEQRLREQTVLTAGLDSVAQLRIGCGDRGCVLLVDGDLHGLSLPWAAARLGAPAVCRDAGDGVGAVDGQLTPAEPVSVRLLSPQRALVGDAAAAQEVLAGLAQATPQFDPAPLREAIPAGALWLVAQRPDDLAAQAATRLAAHDAPWSQRALDRLLAVLARPPEHVALIEVVALALDAGEPVSLRLRLGCRDDRAAATVAALLRGGLWQQRFDARLPSAARQAAGDAEVLRVGRQVEVTLSYPLERVRALMPRRQRGEP